MEGSSFKYILLVLVVASMVGFYYFLEDGKKKKNLTRMRSCVSRCTDLSEKEKCGDGFLSNLCNFDASIVWGECVSECEDRYNLTREEAIFGY